MKMKMKRENEIHKEKASESLLIDQFKLLINKKEKNKRQDDKKERR